MQRRLPRRLWSTSKAGIVWNQIQVQMESGTDGPWCHRQVAEIRLISLLGWVCTSTLRNGKSRCEVRADAIVSSGLHARVLVIILWLRECHGDCVTCPQSGELCEECRVQSWQWTVDERTMDNEQPLEICGAHGPRTQNPARTQNPEPRTQNQTLRNNNCRSQLIAISYI